MCCFVIQSSSGCSSANAGEKAVYAEIARLCGLPRIEDAQEPRRLPAAGKWLTNNDGHGAIAALLNPSSATVRNVPLDNRQYCEEVLEQSLSSPNTGGRRHLLCNVASPGSGKTIVLNFNCVWFVERTKGIAVTVTFNSDQHRSRGISKS